MYGYQIRQEILKRSDDRIDLKEGSLYGPFYRLEKKGFIKSYKILVTGKRYRIYYQITKLGEEYLECALAGFENIYYGANKVLKGENNHGNNKKRIEFIYSKKNIFTESSLSLPIFVTVCVEELYLFT